MLLKFRCVNPYVSGLPSSKYLKYLLEWSITTNHLWWSKSILFISLKILVEFTYFLENIYVLKFNSRNLGKRFKMCSRLTIKTPEQCHWCRYGDFIINFEQFSHQFSRVSIVDCDLVVEVLYSFSTVVWSS